MVPLFWGAEALSCNIVSEYLNLRGVDPCVVSVSCVGCVDIMVPCRLKLIVAIASGSVTEGAVSSQGRPLSDPGDYA